MSQIVVTVDFEGTLTDAETEGRAYEHSYVSDLCTYLQRSIAEVQQAIQSAEAEIAIHPEQYGWKYDGRIVVSATVDPYVRMRAIAEILLDRFGLYHCPAERGRLLDKMYADNRARTPAVFREGAIRLLLQLCAEPNLAVYILTNSGVDGTLSRISRYGNSAVAELMHCRVIGNAGKHIVDSTLEGTSARKRIPGLDRNIYLLRPIYLAALRRLTQDHCIEWRQMVVIGDIFEMDLAMPLQLGAKVMLATHYYTPQYEIDYLSSIDSARVIQSLDEVLPAIRGWFGQGIGIRQ